jgi:hypothetical protein
MIQELHLIDAVMTADVMQGNALGMTEPQFAEAMMKVSMCRSRQQFDLFSHGGESICLCFIHGTNIQ